MKITNENSSLPEDEFKNLLAGKYKKLTQIDVDQLPIGSEVIVIWCGGNGPHKYVVKEKYNRCAVINNGDHLTYVGDDPLNQVWFMGPPQGV